MKEIVEAIYVYEMEHGPLELSSSDAGNDNNALVCRKLLDGHVVARDGVRSGVFVDPWKRPYRFEILHTPRGDELKIRSFGKDGRDDRGTGDDVVFVAPRKPPHPTTEAAARN